MIDRLLAVMPDPMRLVVLDLDVLVLLGVQPQLLRTLLVLEADGVGIAISPALAAARQHATLRGVGGQFPGRHLFSVVDAAGDDRLVGVALEEIDHHFLADARDLDEAEALAGPGHADAHPAAALLVVRAVAVPMELHLHAAVLVGVDFLAAGADDHGGVRALHTGFGGAALGPEDGVGPQRSEAALPVAGAAAGLGRVLAHAHLQLRADVFGVLVGARVAFPG